MLSFKKRFKEGERSVTGESLENATLIGIVQQNPTGNETTTGAETKRELPGSVAPYSNYILD